MRPRFMMLALVFLSAVGCSTGEKMSAGRQIASTTEILYKARSDSKFESPYFLMNDRVMNFHADEDSANGLCKHFGYRGASSFEAFLTDNDVTWFGRDGSFSVKDQKGGFYAIGLLSCR